MTTFLARKVDFASISSLVRESLSIAPLVNVNPLFGAILQVIVFLSVCPNNVSPCVASSSPGSAGLACSSDCFRTTILDDRANTSPLTELEKQCPEMGLSNCGHLLLQHQQCLRRPANVQ